MGVLHGLGDGVQRLWSPLGDALQRGAACTADRKPGERGAPGGGGVRGLPGDMGGVAPGQ